MSLNKEDLRRLCGKAAQVIQSMAEELDEIYKDHGMTKYHKIFIDELYKASMERGE